MHASIQDEKDRDTTLDILLRGKEIQFYYHRYEYDKDVLSMWMQGVRSLISPYRTPKKNKMKISRDRIRRNGKFDIQTNYLKTTLAFDQDLNDYIPVQVHFDISAKVKPGTIEILFVVKISDVPGLVDHMKNTLNFSENPTKTKLTKIPLDRLKLTRFQNIKDKLTGNVNGSLPTIEEEQTENKTT